MSTSADVAIYGGAAGSGKTYAVIIEPLRYIDTPGFATIMFRRTSPQLIGAGSLWTESRGIYPHCGGKARESPRMDWRFPSGATVEFTHLQYAPTVYDHQGKQYALIIFDELTHFEESQFWYMLSRNRSVCGVTPYIRCTTNPDADSWVRKLIDWWIDPETGIPIEERSGKLRWFARVNEDLVWGSSRAEIKLRHPQVNIERILSMTFIGASLGDNPALERADPGYRGRLEALPLVERERLLGRNWNIRPAAGLYFRREYFGIVDRVPDDKRSQRIRGWDLAATQPTPDNPDPDWTAGGLLIKTQRGDVYVADMKRGRGGPGWVEDLIVQTAKEDGHGVEIHIWQDPGSAGKSQAERLRKLLIGYRVHVTQAREDKVTYAGPFSSYAEPRGGVRLVFLVRAPWNEAFLAEAVPFPTGKHDDQIDAVSGAFLHLKGPRSYDWHSISEGERGLE